MLLICAFGLSAVPSDTTRGKHAYI